MYNRPGKRFLCAAGLSAALLLSLTLEAAAQTKLVKRDGWYRDAPIEVFDLKVHDQSVSFNGTFDAGPGWLKDFSFRIKNNSEKKIVCIFMSAVFPETSARAPMARQKFFGRPTNTDVRFDGPALELKPGEVLRVALADEYEGLKKEYDTLERLTGHGVPLDAVNVLELRVTRAYFEDGTMWDLGGLYRPDPDRFGKWILVKQEIFIPPA